jgi:DNA-binding response OmpR family regulator
MRDVNVSAAVVMVTAHGSEQLVADAFRLGADDYVVKGAALGETLPATLKRLAKVRRIGEALRTDRGDILRIERRAGAQAMVLALSHEAAGPLHALATRLEVLQLDAAHLPPAARLQLAAAHEDLVHLTEILERARAMVGTPPGGERPPR